MSQENTPRNNNRIQRRNNQSNPPTPEGTFNLGNTPQLNPHLNLRPQSLYYNQTYPNLPYRNPYPQQPSFNQFSSQHQHNAFTQFSGEHNSYPFDMSQTQFGGSSSQPMSPVSAFRNENLYSPQFDEGYYQNTQRDESPVSPTAPSPPPPLPAKTRRRQKRPQPAQTDEPLRNNPWTQEEEIALCKAWVHVSEDPAKGNARKSGGFWSDVQTYLASKTHLDRRGYDMVLGKWKTVRPNVARFCGVYNNLMRMQPISGAGDDDYYNKATLNYEAEYGVKFTLKHCWEQLRKCQKWNENEVPGFLSNEANERSKRYKSSGSSSFNQESSEGLVCLD